MTQSYPVSAIVGQDDLLLAIQLVAIDPSIGGVLAMGDRGTGKSTAVRALADLLPPIAVVPDCPYGCDPASVKGDVCEHGFAKPGPKSRKTLKPVPVVDLPLGATEDRVLGSLDLDKALRQGELAFSPGLLAQANRGFLYIDEVNLLEDHLVDLLIDVAASGENRVERDGLSIRHPARFVLVGSGNPEEGELRPQLLDRFGLSVDAKTPQDIGLRVEVIKRRDAFERNPEGFRQSWQAATTTQQQRILKARKALEKVELSDAMLGQCASLCQRLGTDGLRAELTLARASRCLAALNGKRHVDASHLRRVAVMALRHRLRRNPLDDTDNGTRVQRAIDEVLS